MVGFLSDPIANPAGEAEGFANVPSQAFQGQDWLAPEKWIGALTHASVATQGQYDPETGVQLVAPEPSVPAADLQKKYGLLPAFGVSGLAFTSDLPESVAADMHDAKLAEQRRADAAARTPDGLVAVAGRFGASTVTQLLDPLGALSMMVPLGGEVKGATMLARAGSALARGAAAGAAVTTPFVALHKLYADEYGEDYSAGDALREILMGGVMGGGLHAGATLAGDLIGRAFRGSPAQSIVDENPDIRLAAASEAVSAAMDERPTQSQGVIELASAVKAREELQRFASYQSSLDDEGAQALAQGDKADQAAAASRNAADQLAALQEQHAGFQADVDDAQSRLQAATDPATSERIAAIDAELADAAIPSARRDTLVTERDMLTEGARTTPEQDMLAAGRAQAELQGLQAGAERVGRQVDQAAAAADQAAAAAASGAKAFRIRAASIEGREALTQSLAERTLRRLAGALNVTLSPEEASGLARSILRERADPSDVVAGITRRAQGADGTALPGLDDGGAAARLGADARSAAGDITAAMAKRSGDAHMAPEDAASIRAAAEAAVRATKPQAVDDAELAELRDFMQRADNAGALDASAKAELESIAADSERMQGWIKALPQAAACLMRSVF